MTSLDSAGLRKSDPYWYEFKTFAKQRWFGRELLEIFTTEFRDRTKEYYAWAIHTGICSVNGKRGTARQIVQDGDLITNRVHRHEPPVTDEPIKILHRDDESGILVIVKPGSVPVHSAGRYYKHTLVELIKKEHGIEHLYTLNRLDRLTSGIMVAATNKKAASYIGGQFLAGLVNKAYVCRCRGEFPEGEVVCKEPILTIDRQSGVNIVHPLGKFCETVFIRLSYDPETDSSAVFCRPITGRTHQIRVHIQWLGHPICNDPIYGHGIWDKVDKSNFSKVVPDQWERAGGEVGNKDVDEVINALKKEKDDKEDWARWKDDVLFGGLNRKAGLEEVFVPGPNGVKTLPPDDEKVIALALEKLEMEGVTVPPKGLNRPREVETKWQKKVREESDTFCEECKIPLLPDPKPEELYIYLHAIKYWTADWSYEDTLPWWAREDWRKVPRKGSGGEGNDAAAKLPPFDIAKMVISNDLKPKIKETEAFVDEESNEVVEPIVRARKVVDFPDKIDYHPALIQLSQGFSTTGGITFEVFRGFEDFAQREILQQLYSCSTDAERHAHSRTEPITLSSVRSALVQISDPFWSNLALRLHLSSRIRVSKASYLTIATERIPLEILTNLKAERVEAGTSNRQRFLKRLEVKKEAKKAGKTTEEIRDQILADEAQIHFREGIDFAKLWSSEVEFLKRIENFWNESELARESALGSYRDVLRILGRHDQDLAEGKKTFRATVDRSGYMMPSLTTMALERYVGTMAWKWLNGPVQVEDPHEWDVDLESPSLEIVLKLSPGFGTDSVIPVGAAAEDNSEGSMVLLIRLPEGPVPPAHRPKLRNELTMTGTPLARYRASALATSLPIPLLNEEQLNGDDSRGRRRMKILEPCCGHASIVLEIASALEAKGIQADVLGCDIEAPTIERAQEIVKLSGFEKPKGDGTDLGVKVDVQVVDGTKTRAILDFVGGPNSVDAIITDLPWGRREKAAQSISSLYSHLMERWLRILRPGGYAVLVTAEQKTLSRALNVFENRCRKKQAPWILKVEDLHLVKPAEEEEEGSGLGGHDIEDATRWCEQNQDTLVVRQGEAECRENDHLRRVEIGYHVYAFLVRKVTY
ncbi:pseudouridine synthase [Violaceomyces palustris]|uniref:Pseudouridine synthase n=1 Tax=Violaceomyces palustris TaxID=1673888 RepID=A0ACD0P797_9BASI|nr:pseudouridine synthase [Violaceomyces palustris]